MITCIHPPCRRIARCLGDLCPLHSRKMSQTDPAYKAAVEAEPEASRIARDTTYCKARRKYLDEDRSKTCAILSESMLKAPRLIAWLLYQSMEPDDDYSEAYDSEDPTTPFHFELSACVRRMASTIATIRHSEGEPLEYKETLFYKTGTMTLPYSDSRGIEDRKALYVFKTELNLPITESSKISTGYLVQRQFQYFQIIANQWLREGIVKKEICLKIIELAGKCRVASSALDQAWFKKLEALEKERKRRIVLEANPHYRFVTDNQNVHTQIAKTATEKALSVIRSWPLPNLEGLTTFEEKFPRLVEAYNSIPSVLIRNQILDTLKVDVALPVTAFDASYDDLLLRLLNHIHRKDYEGEAYKALGVEVWDGQGMCHQGKISRLANVLRGFDDKITACISDGPTREEFMNKMGAIASSALTSDEKVALANTLITDFASVVPEAERASWIEALA